MSDDKIVSLNGGPLHFNHLQDGQLFEVSEVVNQAPLDEFAEVVLVARTHDGQLYIGGTHSTAACSLLLGQASQFIHRAFEPYGGEE